MTLDQINQRPWGVIDLVTVYVIAIAYWVVRLRVHKKDFLFDQHRFALWMTIVGCLLYAIIIYASSNCSRRDDFVMIWIIVGMMIVWCACTPSRGREPSLWLLMLGIFVFGGSSMTLISLSTQDQMQEYQKQGFTYEEAACLTSPDAYNNPCERVILTHKRKQS